MKYLIDTPEVIWGCLDSRRYLEAARRLLRAHQVRERHAYALCASACVRWGTLCARSILLPPRDIACPPSSSPSSHAQAHASGRLWRCVVPQSGTPRSFRCHPLIAPPPQVHELLLSSFSKAALAKFPLLAHQWPIVEKFRCLPNMGREGGREGGSDEGVKGGRRHQIPMGGPDEGRYAGEQGGEE